MERLGERMQFTTGTVPPGILKADTTGERGFSLRVRRRDAPGTVSLLSISGGQPIVGLPPHSRLERCLPHSSHVDESADLLLDLGCDICMYGERQRP